MQAVFGSQLDTIQGIVKNAASAPDASFPETAVRAYSELTDLTNVGPGVASRLLAIARPDRFVSVNGGSKAFLADAFGLARSTLGHPRNYGRLLERVYSKAWYREPQITNAREQTIQWMRAALLDCFVYQR